MIKAQIIKGTNYHCDDCGYVFYDNEDCVYFEIKSHRRAVRSQTILCCKSCIDKTYLELKPTLDTKLWIFK